MAVNVDINQLSVDYNNGMGLVKCGEKYNINKATARRLLHANGVPIRSKGRPKGSKNVARVTTVVDEIQGTVETQVAGIGVTYAGKALSEVSHSSPVEESTEVQATPEPDPGTPEPAPEATPRYYIPEFPKI